jgi:hypothetical protein
MYDVRKEQCRYFNTVYSKETPFEEGVAYSIYLSIYLSIHPWLYSPLLGLGGFSVS